MNKYWFGMVANWDYMATFGCFAEADSVESAIEIIQSEYPNCTIKEVVVMSNGGERNCVLETVNGVC